MNKYFYKLMFVILIAMIAPEGRASEAIQLTAQDRILIVAPHPDDETIGAAGVIQEAVQRSIPVRVLYLTNGDSNQLSFLFYKKNFIFGSRQAVAMGELRQKEAASAMRALGLNDDHLTFLGYPDYGTLNIFRRHWGNAKPYRGALTRATAVPYERSLTPGALYKGESILTDIKKVLTDFKPTKIIVNHPADMNADHQAAYLFTRVALWDLEGSLEPELYTYMVHALGWPRPLGLHPHVRLDPVDSLHLEEEDWLTFELDAAQVERKKKAVSSYRSQIPYKPNFLFTFVRANEVFTLVSDITLQEQTLDRKAWEELDDSQQLKHDNKKIDMRHRTYLESVVYALEPGTLVVKIKLNQWSHLGFDINLYVMGYKKGVPFEQMPKYRLQLTNDHQVVVFDGPKRTKVKNVTVRRQGNDLFVSVPLSVLREPEKIISSGSVRIRNLPEESSVWTVLEIKP
jgi:LmbE family N-acetylglucosaminyl deacetylase